MVMGLYILSRVVFLLIYPRLVGGLDAAGWFAFGVLSLRYDLSALASLNLLFILLCALPLPYFTRFFSGIRLMFCLVNGLFLSLNLADTAFFAYNSRRLTWPQLDFLKGDALSQMPQFLVHYWPLIPGVVVIVWLMAASFGPVPGPRSGAGIRSGLVAGLIWLALGILSIRNSLGLKPLLPAEAFTLSQNEAGHAILNTPFLVFKTLETSELPESAWIPEKELDHFFPPGDRPAGQLKGYNLVLIILESFSTEYTGLEGHRPSYTPFLDSLAREGWYFPQHWASGSTSRDALPSVLSSIPPWMDESFSSSPYLSVRQEGLGKTLNRAGYWTGFFHGGKNGTMSFDLYSRIAGFDQYFGLNEYPGSGDYDGNWGIFDEPYLQYVARTLNTRKPPFAGVVFTLSSHQPYTLPAGFSGKFAGGALPILPAIGYSDYALRRFFATASQMPWYKQTLFVITADHTQQRLYPDRDPFRGRFDVPLLLFVPGKKHILQPDTARAVQHTDIAPGIRDALGLEPELKNGLGGGWNRGPAIPPMVWADGLYQLILPGGILRWEGRKAEEGWSWLPDAPGKTEPAGVRRTAMARLQLYRNGLRRDRLFR